MKETLIIAGGTHYLRPKYIKLDFFKWDSDNYKRAFLISGNLEYYADYDLSLHQEPFKWEIQKNVFWAVKDMTQDLQCLIHQLYVHLIQMIDLYLDFLQFSQLLIQKFQY